VSAGVLVLSTSSPALSLAFFNGQALVAHDHRIIGRGHAEALVPAIAALLGNRRATAIIVDIGPGSFTGIRIGIAADHATGPLATIAVDALEIAADALEIAIGEATAGTAAPAGRGQRIPAGEPDAAFALRLPIAARCLEPVAFYVRPPDAVLPL